jgi:hypothetical protein
MSKKAALESEKTQDDLEHNEEYQRLKRRLDGLRAELDETVDELDEEDFSAAFYALSRRRSGRPDADDR